MTDSDTMLAEATKLPDPKFHGLLMKCVDKSGNSIYQKIIGHSSLTPGAPSVRANATLQIGSATKLLTSIALLQCIERKLVNLHDPVTALLPELSHPQIVTLNPDNTFT